MQKKVNIKVSSEVHSEIVKISEETGVNIYKLAEMGLMKLIDDYNNGVFDILKKQASLLSRDGKTRRG
jgi:hypothetical protein